MESHLSRKRELFLVGVIVMALLAGLTLGELIFGLVAPTLAAVFLLVALLKVYFVLRDYMHIDRLFSDEE
jgi:hypothetical protein